MTILQRACLLTFAALGFAACGGPSSTAVPNQLTGSPQGSDGSQTSTLPGTPQTVYPLEPAVFEVLDLGNRGDGSDIGVRFVPEQGDAQAESYHLLIHRSDNGDRLDLESALSLPPSNRVTIVPTEGEKYFRLPENARDTEGEPIQEGVPYLAQVLLVRDSGDALSEPSGEFELRDELTVYTLVQEFPSATGGLAVDRDGYLYAADIGSIPSRSGEDIYRISPQGEVSLWVTGEGLRGASGNTMDAQGNLYQSSLSASLIHLITPEGRVSVFAEEGVQGPVGITAAPDGTLFVANCRGNSVQRLTTDGASTRFAESVLFSCPNGITVDDSGVLYISNFSNGKVLRVLSDGTVQEFVSIPGSNNGHILFHAGLLYVVSRGGHQIYTLTLGGEIRLLAGTGERGHTDGPADQATFSLPNDIVASPDGQRLYINEVVPTAGRANLPSRIRVLELTRRE